MIEEENEKIVICPDCLESLATNLYFASDGQLYHKNCFDKLTFKSPISRQVSSYYIPKNKVVNGRKNFEDKTNNNFKTLIYDSAGFNQDGFNRKGFDRDGFNINRIDEIGFNRNKEINCEEKIK